jgi:molybdopterin-biosynthesis enzyme MoeA-like protein
MADFPQGVALIPNPVNRVPGFSLGHHHFFPGFPDMAWPMLDWVLATHYPDWRVEPEVDPDQSGRLSAAEDDRGRVSEA